MKNRKIKQISLIELIKSIRRRWTINPSSRIIPNKKIYNRKKIDKQDDK